MKKTLVALVVAAVVLGGVGVAWSATSGGGTSSGSAATLTAAATTGKHPAARRAVVALALKTAADTIHVDRKALVQELRSGRSIAEVANEHNVSPDTVTNAIVQAATQKLTTAQSNGKLTADQVQKAEQRLPQLAEKLVNGKAKVKPRATQRRRALRGALKTAADTIHVDQKALVQELRSGKSIAEVANEHNVSPDTVTNAIVQAATQKLTTAQSNGKLTADQVQKAEQRLPQLADKLVNGKVKVKARATLRRRALRGALKTAADTIHVDQKALVQELRSGKSIADVANEHNVSPATVTNAIVGAAKQKLTTLQSSGKLTADQVQKIEQRLPQAVDKLVNAKRGPHAPATTNDSGSAQQSSIAA